MFTNWEQVQSWIEDNNFRRWVFFKNNPEGRETAEKGNDKIVDSNNFSVSDMADKLAMTQKYLRMYGGRAYGMGFKSDTCTSAGGTICEVRLDDAMTASGIGMPRGVGEAELRERIKAELQAEWEKREYQRLRKELDEERAEFDKLQNSVWGVVVHKLAPVAIAALGGNKESSLVAGLDTKDQVHADPVKPIVVDANQENANPDEQREGEPFTDAENEALYTILVEFKKLEPEYLKLLKGVLAMKKSGNPMYDYARDMILKQVEE